MLVPQPDHCRPSPTAAQHRRRHNRRLCAGKLSGSAHAAENDKMTVRVFLVEDRKPMEQLIGDLLDSIGGYQLVGSAAGETQATDWLMKNRGRWDLAIVDLLLEEGSGFTLLTRCRKDLEGSGHVVVFSDFVSPAVQQRCKRLGADRVIPKAHFAQLRSYLQGFLGRGASLQPA